MYAHDYDEMVFMELSRQQRVVQRNLTDYFQYGNTFGRSLADIVFLDILNEKVHDDHDGATLSSNLSELEQVNKIVSYIETRNE